MNPSCKGNRSEVMEVAIIAHVAEAVVAGVVAVVVMVVKVLVERKSDRQTRKHNNDKIMTYTKKEPNRHAINVEMKQKNRKT